MLTALLNVLGLYATVLMDSALLLTLWLVRRCYPEPDGLAPIRWLLWWKALEYGTVTLIDFLVLAHLVDRTDPLFVVWRRNGGRLVSAISTVGFLLMYVAWAPPRGPQP